MSSKNFSNTPTSTNSILKNTETTNRMRSPSKNNLNGGNDYAQNGVELPIKMANGSGNHGSVVENDDSLENNDSALRKYGWLYKLSQNGLKLWKKRYFVLTDYILDYYSGLLIASSLDLFLDRGLV